MQELKTKFIPKTEELSEKAVSFYINSSFISVTGDWSWNLNTSTIFCSDVIISPPAGFEGTSGIIHPDDAVSVREAVLQNNGRPDRLEFRIITSYGEVKNVVGHNLKIQVAEEEAAEMQAGIMKQVSIEQEWKKEVENLALVREVYEKAERYKGTGVWWYNIHTNETWYSNQIFRIYDLPPQSLNPHLKTFTDFIHPEDKELVNDYIDKAYKKRIPLHIEYRIKTPKGVKSVLHITNWFFTNSGEEILSGSLQDITEQKQFDQKLEHTVNSSEFYRMQLHLDEQNASMGHWQVDLVTRKTIYSDNYYRIFGLRAQSVPTGINALINYVHPEDRHVVNAANKKMLYEHKVPELDFRIIRSDGKLRYVSQKGKLVSYGDSELIMTGSLQDITVQKMLEKKVRELTELQSVRDFSHQQAEEIAGIGSWVWDIDTGKIQWSDSFYKLLGLKPNSVEITQKRLLLFVHPDDQKKFTDELAIILQQKQNTVFEFRLLLRGEVKHMKASFKLMTNDGSNQFIGTIQDITKENILQQQLHQRMQLAEALSENIFDRVIITDLSNNIIAWNRPCEEIYNIKKGDAIGSNFFDVFPHLKTEEVVQLFNKVLKGEMIFQKANKSSLATGHFDLHMVPLWNEEQTEVTGIILILHDVTKEIELQQNLNDRLSLIENLVESSVDRIIAIDRNLNYLVWNKRCEEYYGLRKEKVIGRNVLEIFPDTQNTPTYEEFKKVLRGETIHIAARKDSGKEDYHEIYLIPVKNEKDNIIAILWILHDLSKEFEAENKLIEQTSLLQAVFDASLNGIILFKAVRNAEKEILDYEVVLNNQTTRVWNGRDLTGKRYGEEFPGIRQFGIFAGYNKVLETGEPMNLEVHYNEGGLDAWFRISAVKLNEDELVATAENITARKKTGEDAERYREVLQQTTSATPDAITVYDLENHQPVYLNNCLSEWLGYTTEELMKMGFTGRLQLIHADDRNALAAFNENLVAEKTDNVASVDYRVHAKNGSIVWLRNRSRIFRKNENQKVTHILSILQDITKEKNFNDQIDLQNKIFGYAEEIANMGTWTWNPDTNQVTYSDNMFNLFGLDRSVTPGFDTLPPFIHPDDRARILQMANDLKEGEDSKEAEYRVIRADGAERIFRNKTKLLRTEKNDRLFIGTTQDITDEITLRRKLEERTQYAESMIDSSINRMLVYDKDMNIIGWNRRSEEIMGVKKEQAIGKNVFELFPKVGEDPELKKAYEDALKGDYIYLPAKRSTYLNIYYERFFIPLKDTEGKTYAVLNTMHDVTDMVNRSKELLQLNNVLEQKNRELEQKNEEITHFAFVASHDLKEPLRKMRTFSDWILHHENLSETGSSFLNKLTGAVKRMDRLIEDILVLTKIHADDRRDEEVKLAVVLEDVIAEMKEDILSSQTTIESDSLPSIKGNSNQVFYLFKNLISNAIKFQNKGSIPNIKIDASVVRNESNAFNSKDDYLCVRFVDNGFGFDVKLSRKIFQVFQRLHSRNEFEGTGMGLAICKKIMENHNGFIKVKSEEGKGSEFACYFPLS